MEETQYISYGEWISLITAIREKGLKCKEFQSIKSVYPQVTGEVYIPMIYNELGKLEKYMLTYSFSKFLEAINRCLEEMDIEIAETGIRNLKKNFKECMFFRVIPEYPESIKKAMAHEIQKKMESFRQEFLKYLKKLAYSDNSNFVQDLIFICKRRYLYVDLGE